MRLLRPFVVIRFGSLLSGRIGHFAASTELYLCEREAGIQNRRSLDIFYHIPPICNQQLKKMCSRKLYIFNFVRWIDRLNRYIPGGKIHEILLTVEWDVHNLFASTATHLAFITREEQLGMEALRKLGIVDKSGFVCFYARDPAYLNTLFPAQNWRYHKYRDTSICNYMPAVEELTRRGYFAVRMGAVVKEPLKCSNSAIIDYATNGRTDFLDIFLSAKCRFFISSCAGLDAVPRIFRRPIVYVNVIPLHKEFPFCCTHGYLFIPKKLWLSKEGRFLTLSEIISSGAGEFFALEQYEQAGIEVIENSAEEIFAVVMEMEERLKGTWQATGEDEQLQQSFWSIFCSILGISDVQKRTNVRVGTKFLHQNKEFLQ